MCLERFKAIVKLDSRVNAAFLIRCYIWIITTMEHIDAFGADFYMIQSNPGINSSIRVQ
jgi:hypothetical protein